MVKSLLRLFGINRGEVELEKFEPVYGLPKQSLEEWLARNPALRKDYGAELLSRSQQRQSARNKW